MSHVAKYCSTASISINPITPYIVYCVLVWTSWAFCINSAVPGPQISICQFFLCFFFRGVHQKGFHYFPPEEIGETSGVSPITTFYFWILSPETMWSVHHRIKGQLTQYERVCIPYFALISSHPDLVICAVVINLFDHISSINYQQLLHYNRIRTVSFMIFEWIEIGERNWNMLRHLRFSVGTSHPEYQRFSFLGRCILPFWLDRSQIFTCVILRRQIWRTYFSQFRNKTYILLYHNYSSRYYVIENFSISQLLQSLLQLVIVIISTIVFYYQHYFR